MAQTYPLDPVIRIVAQKEPIRTLDKVLVVIEASSGRALERIDVGGASQLHNLGLIAGLWTERKYFLVSNEYDPRNEVEASLPEVQLRDFANNWSLPLTINYLVRCRQGNEVKLVEALWAGSHPGAALHDSLNRWVKEFGGSQTGNVIQNFYSKQRELEAYLERKAEDELGLTLQATARVRVEPREQIQLGPVHIPVRIKEDTVDQDLKFEARLSVDPQKKMAAIIYRDHEAGLDNLLKTEIQKYCLSNVSLQSLHFNAPGKLEADLTAYLNNIVRPYGRYLSFLSVQLMAQKPGQIQPDSFFETRKEVEYEIAEFKVPIKNHVQMSLQDYGLYKRTGSLNLDSWIEENLEEIIHQVLFGKQYLDLLIKFDPLKEEIKQRLSLRANSIGYSIKQLITIPNLEQYDWLENFTLEVAGSFETKTPRFPVSLGVVVVTRIRHLQDVETHLNRRQNVPDLMKALILEQTRQALHGIEPERFYMQFSYSDPEEGISVEEELRKRLTASLTSKFNADVISIVFKMLDTEMTGIWETLEKSEGDLEIVFPSYSEMTENLTYRATLRIEAIHKKGWPRFRTANKDLPNLCRRLQEHIISKLGVFANDQLIFTNYEGQKKVELYLDQIARKFALDEFGLVIRLNSLRRDVTVTEQTQKALINKTLKAIATLESRIVDEMLIEGRPEKIRVFEEQIGALREKLPVGVRGTIANFNRPGELPAAPPSQLPEPPSRKAFGHGANAGNNGHKESE